MVKSSHRVGEPQVMHFVHFFFYAFLGFPFELDSNSEEKAKQS